MWYLFTYKFPLVADVPAVARVIECSIKSKDLNKAIDAYIDQRVNKDSIPVSDLKIEDFSKYIKQFKASEKYCCHLKNCDSAQFAGLVFSNDMLEKRAKQEDTDSVSIVFCHDFNNLHRVGFSHRTIIATSNGSVFSCDVDKAQYRNWLENRFMKGDTALSTFDMIFSD
ncbi:hypothetical protein [Planctomicrobium sp. SH527]|uniref:hypothetical protein n=1 Tax=Planctomicrobium sp. SH527 TaxID=3448123 RepID=UPI003F5B2AEF